MILFFDVPIFIISFLKVPIFLKFDNDPYMSPHVTQYTKDFKTPYLIASVFYM